MMNFFTHSVHSRGGRTPSLGYIEFMKLLFTWIVCFALSFVMYPLSISAEEAAYLEAAEVQSAEQEQEKPAEEQYDISDISTEDLNSIKTGDEFAAQDDFEGFNRAMFGLNRAIDKVVIKPVATVYGDVVPQFPKNRVSDFVANLHEPVYFLNHVLQLNPEGAADSLGRFLFNSTFGLLGLMDVASEAGIARQETDFGLTLKHYGMGTGPYLVLPIIGPSSLRDAPSLAVDAVADPFNCYKFPRWWKIARYSTELVSKRERNLKTLDQLEETSLDFYATVRSIYLQKR